MSRECGSLGGCPSRGERRPAFALAAVMVALVLVTVALIGVARASLTMAAETARLKHDFQLRWGSRSCQAALLELAPQLFDRLEEQARREGSEQPAPARLDYRFVLGRVSIAASVRDDSAAFDVNTAYHYVGRARLESSLRRLLGGPSGILVRLRPSVPSQGKPEVRRPDVVFPVAFEGWGQVFRTEQWGAAARQTALVAMTRELTCSPGSGLNVRRAPREVIEATCELVVSAGQAKKIADRCGEYPRPHIHRVLEQLGVDRRDQVLLKQLLTEQSACYSVWVDARRAGRHRLSSATVRYGDDGTYGVSSFCY